MATAKIYVVKAFVKPPMCIGKTFKGIVFSDKPDNAKEAVIAMIMNTTTLKGELINRDSVKIKSCELCNDFSFSTKKVKDKESKSE